LTFPKLRFSYVSRLWSLLAFGDFKFDVVAFLQTLVSFGGDGAVVNKNPYPFALLNFSVPFIRSSLTFGLAASCELGEPEITANYDASLRD
jgi:hypothetical protein